VEVKGVSGPGDFAPIVQEAKFQVLGRAPLPVAPDVTLDNLFSGRQDSNWVEVEGIVRAVTGISEAKRAEDRPVDVKADRVHGVRGRKWP
jgi:hypothetical protein